MSCMGKDQTPSEPSIPGAEFAMSDLEGSWQMVEGEIGRAHV